MLLTQNRSSQLNPNQRTSPVILTLRLTAAFFLSVLTSQSNDLVRSANDTQIQGPYVLKAQPPQKKQPKQLLLLPVKRWELRPRIGTSAKVSGESIAIGTPRNERISPGVSLYEPPRNPAWERVSVSGSTVQKTGSDLAPRGTKHRVCCKQVDRIRNSEGAVEEGVCS